tara:strand:+ start:287 stop:631 length:345 start_codon:yes stop_codon:yes gene_type:complete
MFLYCIKLLLSYYNNVKYIHLIYEFLFFLSVASLINCHIYGNCNISALIIFAVNVFLIILYIRFKYYIYIGKVKDNEINNNDLLTSKYKKYEINTYKEPEIVMFFNEIYDIYDM